MAIIEIENVSKSYRASRGTRVFFGRGGLADLLRGKGKERFTALQDINFSVEPGESIGIIGANGSGKSTLLKIIAGVTTPTTGHVRVYGRVASLLELGAGFHPMLTGRENVYLNAGIYGMRHAQVDEVFDKIVEFSGIAKFIDAPVATYSSGMYVRLGFSVAAHTNPDVFLIDEVLAVGDEVFQRRCRAKIGELMESGKTILFVSHDLAIVNVLCKNVILLSQGRMITRDTPSKAIDFYLRQIGEPKGVHTLRQGRTEAIVCNGRISIFYDQNEVTSAQGLRCQVHYLQGWHLSQDADWEISERSETRCVARGHMPKLGLTLVWELSLDGEDVVWAAGFECTAALQPDITEAYVSFPLHYTQWSYDGETGKFYEVTAEDTTWMPVKAQELLCEHAGLLGESEEVPAVRISCESTRTNIRASWWNSDYMSRGRNFVIQDSQGEDGQGFYPGFNEWFRARFAIGASREAILRGLGEQSSRQTVESGPLRARFDRGQLKLSWGERLLTSSVHVYSSMLIQNLWNDSVNLRWERLERQGDTLRVCGISRRFPFRMHWTISPGAPGAIDLRIDLEALDRIDVQEYHTSILLNTAFNSWETSGEKGTFPEITPITRDWKHLNRNYAPGGFACATGEGMPVLEFRPEAYAVRRMTVLNTEFAHNSRVLQALSTPDHGVFTFEPGRHPYFAGTIVVSPSTEAGR